MLTPIPGLHGSLTFRTAIELYERHCDRGDEVCARCGDRVPCPSRSHAISVIFSAGEDPGSYDTRQGPSTEDPAFSGQGKPERQRESGASTAPTYTGYQLGGRGRRRVSPEYYSYDRDNS
jgi:hypothetical protein